MNDPRRITTKELLLSQIVTDAGTQVRTTIDEETVANYAAEMEAGDKFPNIVTYYDGTSYFLADGFHRLFAAERLRWQKIRAEIHQGNADDALRYALSANATHGLRRTNDDKQRSAALALRKWPENSDRVLAKICAVSHTFIAAVRIQLATVASSNTLQSNETRLGADGKTRKLPDRNGSTDHEEAYPDAQPQEEETPRFRPSDGFQKTEPRVTEWFEAVDRLVDDAIKTATDKQLVSMSVALAAAPKRVKAEIYRRKQEEKAA
jgi:hypothetical protein